MLIDLSISTFISFDRSFIGNYYFCSQKSKPEPVIVMRNIVLLATEAKGADDSMAVAYPQAVQVASDAACRLLEAGLPIECCVIPFITCTGHLIQFGVVQLLPQSYPMAFRLSSELSLLVRVDRIKISSMLWSLAQHLQEMSEIALTAIRAAPKSPSTGFQRALLDQDAHFFKPVFTKWIDMAPKISKQHHRSLHLNYQLCHCMDIFKNLSQLESVCAPIGMMAMPNRYDQERFHSFVSSKIEGFKASYKDFIGGATEEEVFLPGHPILIFPNLQILGWKNCTEDNISPDLYGNREAFISALSGVLEEVGNRGVIHLDLRLENIFYRVRNGNFEIKIIDWNDAMFLDDPIPPEYYQEMQENTSKYPSNISVASREFHVHSLQRINQILQQVEESTVGEELSKMTLADKGVNIQTSISNVTKSSMKVMKVTPLQGINKWNKEKLQEESQKRGLDTTGTKEILKNRIVDYENKKEQGGKRP